MKIAGFAYRDWAQKIFTNLQDVGYEFTTLDNADVVLYYGWSEIIPEDIYTKKLCLILHPSPLPKYRGGSPLQHQIMNGETKSAVTILKVGKELDAGDIYSQTTFSLNGSLQDILERITEIGTIDTILVLKNIEKGLKPWKQEGQFTKFKRRTPEESQITIDHLKDADTFYNFVRALGDPYPNAYIEFGDGKKVYLTGVKL